MSGVAITSPTNTFANVLEGVTLTVTKADTPAVGSNPSSPTFVEAPVTVDVKKDADGIAAKISALVDAANAARSEAKSLTAMDPTTKAKGRLYGDSGVRALVDRVRAAIVDGDAEVGLAGVSVARDGTISFDKAKFLERLAKEPAKVEAALGKDGMAGRLHQLADEVSRPEASTGGAGLITSGIKSREGQITNLKDGIANWDVRLAAKEKMLQRQYTALETALGKAKSQGSWLAGQLASLPQAGS
jgi:flagellar hook-associated protein 2